MTAVALLVGMGVRVEAFAARRSLWLDEAMLSLNLVHRSFGGLARPLAYNQGAPVGWLWLQRMLLVGFGPNEYALRVIPLVSGCAALVVVTLIARRTIGRWAAAGAAMLLAFAPVAIRYSNEVKQYSSDLFIAASLILLTLVVGEQEPRGRWLWCWGAVAAVSVWFSHPALLVVAACSSALVVHALLRRRIGIIRVAVASSGWIASAAVLYLISLRSLAANASLRSYWAKAMAPRPLTVSGLVSWLGRDVPRLFANPGHLGPPIVAVMLSGAGVAVLFSGPGRRLLGLILVITFVFAVGAAGVDRYPLVGRLALYLLVVVILALAAVVQWCADRVPRRTVLAVAGLLVTATVVSSAMAASLSYVRHPFTTPDTRDVLRFVRDQRRAGDHVWVQWPEVPDAQFYAPIVKLYPDGQLDDGGGTGSGGCDGQTPTAAAQGERAWVVLGYKLSTAPPDERGSIIASLAQMAALVQVRQRGGAVAFLFDFGLAHNSAPTPARALQCLVVTPLPGVVGST